MSSKAIYNTFAGSHDIGEEDSQIVGSKISRQMNPNLSTNFSFWNRVKSLSYSTAIVTVATVTIFFCSILLISAPSKLNSDLVKLKQAFRPVFSTIQLRKNILFK